MHVCVLMVPSMFGHVTCSFFFFETNEEGPFLLNFHICVWNSQVRLPKDLQESHKKNPKAAAILPWQCKSTKPNDAQFVDWSPIDGEESIIT